MEVDALAHRAQLALSTRRSLLVALLRHALHRLRAHVSTTSGDPHLDSLSAALHLSSLVRLARQLPPDVSSTSHRCKPPHFLSHSHSSSPSPCTPSATPSPSHSPPTSPKLVIHPSTPSPSPSLSPHPQSITSPPSVSSSSTSPSTYPTDQTHAVSAVQEASPSSDFQKRTFYRSESIDEFRAPTAAWPLQPSRLSRPASSLQLHASTTSLSSLDDGSPRYGFAYGAFRVDHINTDHMFPTSRASRAQLVDADSTTDMFGRNDIDTNGNITRADCVNGSSVGVNGRGNVHAHGNTTATTAPPRRFFRPNLEAIRVVTLRQCVFEIGADGRIRRWSPAPA